MAKEYKKVTADKKKQAKRLLNESQLTKCNVAIHTAATTCAAAGATPIPVADAVPITATQVVMVMALGKIFDTKVSESAAKSLISAAASAFIGRSLVKMIPIVGWGISAAVAAGVTEAIGWTIAVDFAKDAKSRWEREHTASDNNSQSNTSESETEESGSEDRGKEFLDDLEARAKVFLSGEKKRSDYEAEFSELLSDFEKILDSLPNDCHLRKIYDDLCNIIE